MKVLIIEDSSLKLDELKRFFEENLPEWEVQDAQSHNTAMCRIIDEKWDYLILDMTLPNYDSNGAMDNDHMESMAGSMIINRMNHLGIVIPTIIVTKFVTFGMESLGLEEINRILKEKFSNIWCGTVFYDETTGEWKEKLLNLLMEQEAN